MEEGATCNRIWNLELGINPLHGDPIIFNTVAPELGIDTECRSSSAAVGKGGWTKL